MKTVTIYQLPICNPNTFRGLACLPNKVDITEYCSIWREYYPDYYPDFDYDDEELLEDMFSKFNFGDKQINYAGRSISVSDILVLYDEETDETKYYYCDSFGWKNVTEDITNTETEEEEE